MFVSWLALLSVNWKLIDSEVLKVSDKLSDVIVAIRISLPIDEKLN